MAAKNLALFTMLLLGLISTLRAETAADWAHIRNGMSMAETTAAIGEPLFRTKAREYDTWQYDNCGQVIFYHQTILQFTVPIIPADKTPKISQDLTIPVPEPPAISEPLETQPHLNSPSPSPANATGRSSHVSQSPAHAVAHDDRPRRSQPVHPRSVATVVTSAQSGEHYERLPSDLTS